MENGTERDESSVKEHKLIHEDAEHGLEYKI